MSDYSESINLPNLKEWNIAQVYDFVEQVADYSDLDELAKSINAARIALFKINERINIFERKEIEAKTKYDRAFRRAYLESTDKTDSMKKMKAALACENLENNYIAAEQLKKELVRVSHVLRSELQTLQAIGNNMRQQLKME